MTDLANSAALAMRRRVLRRKRIELVLTWTYHGLALFGVGFIIAIVVGVIG